MSSLIRLATGSSVWSVAGAGQCDDPQLHIYLYFIYNYILILHRHNCCHSARRYRGRCWVDLARPEVLLCLCLLSTSRRQTAGINIQHWDASSRDMRCVAYLSRYHKGVCECLNPWWSFTHLRCTTICTSHILTTSIYEE